MEVGFLAFTPKIQLREHNFGKLFVSCGWKRTSAIGSGGSGLVRRGSLTYRKAADGSLEFEGADFDGGRFTAGQVIYHITDHLGSVIGIVRSGSTTPYEYDMYDAYGKRTRTQLSAPFTPEASLRFCFTGKEDQSVEFSVPYTDFGARHYSPALTRWLTPDPLSEKYYGISPYAYCNGDPVNLVDLDGESWGDKVVGMLVGTLTNLIPFSSFLRDFYSPDNSTDYNNALKSTDKAAMITGEVLTTGGTAAMAAGTIATEAGGALALSGVGAPAGAVATTAGATATIAGATATAEGAILMANSASNSSQGYSRGKSNNSEESSWENKPKSAGHMRKITFILKMAHQ